MGLYRLTNAALAANEQIVVMRSDGASIPKDPSNADWQAYLAWLAQGNTPDPYAAPALSPQDQFAAGIAAGVTLVWSVSTTLNGLWDCDQQTQDQITAEMVSINTNGTFTNGAASRAWYDFGWTAHTFTVAQFKIFATAIGAHVDAWYGTLVGGSVPNATVNVNG
jgi:hypothetical protein